MVELPVEARPNSPGIHYRTARAALALLLSASPCSPSRPSTGAPALPPFVVTVRAYGGAGHDAAQLASMQELGLEYVHGFVGFNWHLIEALDDDWKWAWVDERMDLAAELGLRVIPFLAIPKEDLPWITRTDPGMPEEYGEYAFDFTRHYRDHPAWSGMVGVWEGPPTSSSVTIRGWLRRWLSRSSTPPMRESSLRRSSSASTWPRPPPAPSNGRNGTSGLSPSRRASIGLVFKATTSS